MTGITGGSIRRPFGVWLYCEAPQQKRNEFVSAHPSFADALRAAEAKKPEAEQRRRAGHPANISVRIGGKIVLWTDDGGFTGVGFPIAQAERDGKPVASLVDPLEKKAEELRRTERVERATRRLREVTDKVDPADAGAVVNAYIEARRRCGILWNKMMDRLGVSLDAPPEVKAQARQDAQQLDNYGDYIDARKVRDACAVLIDADRKAHRSFLDEARVDDMALEADLKAAYREVNRDAVAQQRAEAKVGAKSQGTPAGSPRPASSGGKDDLTRHDNAVLVSKRPINGGVMGILRIADAEVGYVAFGRGAEAVSAVAEGDRLNVLVGPNPKKPGEVRIAMAYPAGERRFRP